MMDLVGTGGAGCPAELVTKWNAAVASGNYLALHTLLDAANNAMYRTDGGAHCPISASF